MKEQPQLIAETNEYLFVYKPRGMHSVRGEHASSIAAWLEKNHPRVVSFGRNENDCGLLNRLDFETCGIVQVAKSNAARDRYVLTSEGGKIKKEYLFLSTKERQDSWTCNDPIGQNSRTSKRVKTASQSTHIRIAQSATTEFVYQAHADATLYKATIYNGRRHQIRVHAEVSGVPLINDTLYNGTPSPYEDKSFFLFHNKLSSEELAVDITCPNEFAIEFAEALETFKITPSR